MRIKVKDTAALLNSIQLFRMCKQKEEIQMAQMAQMVSQRAEELIAQFLRDTSPLSLEHTRIFLPSTTLSKRDVVDFLKCPR